MATCPVQVYRPRRPERTDFYRILEKHFDAYVWAYEERFELSSGPLRPVVRSSVEAFLGCGRPEGGFARIKCPDCKAERLLTFSCRTRCFCPSCQAKRAALFAEKLVEDLLAPVPHRHYVFTLPIALRGLFRRERRLPMKWHVRATSLARRSLGEGGDRLEHTLA
jgi:ribosomal protein S27E